MFYEPTYVCQPVSNSLSFRQMFRFFFIIGLFIGSPIFAPQKQGCYYSWQAEKWINHPKVVSREPLRIWT